MASYSRETPVQNPLLSDFNFKFGRYIRDTPYPSSQINFFIFCEYPFESVPVNLADVFSLFLRYQPSAVAQGYSATQWLSELPSAHPFFHLRSY